MKFLICNKYDVNRRYLQTLFVHWSVEGNWERLQNFPVKDLFINYMAKSEMQDGHLFF
jgi:hypothetical protein